MPTKFDKFDAEAYGCLILPGIINPLPALFDEASIRFLKELSGKDILIASISSSPLLLAKAGLLENRQFTCGVFKEMLDFLTFMPKQNVVRVPVHRDGNIITALGFAFREFAAQVLRASGFDCEASILQGVTKEYTEEELTYQMGEENFKEFLALYKSYMQS